MIPKKPVPDPIGDGYRFSEKIMRQEKAKAAGSVTDVPTKRGL
jgi:hypothetical protein